MTTHHLLPVFTAFGAQKTAPVEPSEPLPELWELIHPLTGDIVLLPNCPANGLILWSYLFYGYIHNHEMSTQTADNAGVRGD